MMCAVGKSRFRAGFTLLELLMVVVIIGVLMGILMPVVNSMKQSALKKQREAEARLIESAIRNYHADNGEWPGTKGQSVYFADNATLIDSLNNGAGKLVLLDVDNMTMDPARTVYRKPGTTNNWKITITTTNRTVTVE